MSRAGSVAKAAAAKAALGVSAKAGTALAGALLPLLIIGGLAGALIAVVVIAAVTVTNNSDPQSSGGVHCAPSHDEDEDSDEGPETVPEAEIPSEYQEDVADTANAAGVPEALVAALIYYESNWNEDAVSHVGARGLGQFMPQYWEDEWGDIDDPNDNIHAVGQRLAELRDQMEPHSDNEEHMWELMLAGYNAGGPAVAEFDYDLDRMLSTGSEDDINSYAAQTGPYVENITAAAAGHSGSNCSVPQGDLVKASMHLAWEEEVTLPHSSANDHGRDDAREEFVETAESIHESYTHAFYTDCGVFVSTAVRSSGTDDNFQLRDTTLIEDYVHSSDDWETFTLENEGQLHPGDVFIATDAEGGHTYIYTGERPDGDPEAGTHRAQGASLYTRPPSGHFVTTTMRGTPYTIARHTGSVDSSDTDEDED